MEKLITSIHDISVEMNRAFKEENFEELEKLLTERDDLMIKVDRYKADYPAFQYTSEEKQLLEEAYLLDQQLMTLLKDNITETKQVLNQHEQKKQLSKKFLPYLKQTNGVFLDSKK